ncbi:hypothetical protein QBC43DRAFT_39902 [Cladorrhinum sp. PSN259]|nr:hypothetical protein QBC43DRAFT_39902 [Cladorrhinum sp. PSN259]
MFFFSCTVVCTWKLLLIVFEMSGTGCYSIDIIDVRLVSSIWYTLYKHVGPGKMTITRARRLPVCVEGPGEHSLVYYGERCPLPTVRKGKTGRRRFAHFQTWLPLDRIASSIAAIYRWSVCDHSNISTCCVKRPGTRSVKCFLLAGQAGRGFIAGLFFIY